VNMLHLTGFLNTVLDPAILLVDKQGDEAPLPNGGHEPDSDGAGIEDGGSAAGDSNSEDIHMSLQFIEPCMDYHSIEGTMCNETC
jgi:hypothetical protein